MTTSRSTSTAIVRRTLATRTLRFALLLLPALLFAIAAWRSRTVIDDAYINLRIVDQILAGNGIVFNAGERVEAGTSPAWLAVLTVLAAIAGGTRDWLPWISIVAGILAGAGGVMLAQATSARLWRDVRAADPRWPAALMPAGVWIVLAVRPFFEFAASGLESGLSLLWIAGAAFAIVTAETRRRQHVAAIILGLGPLVRPEFAVFGPPLFVALAWTSAGGLRAWIRLGLMAAAVPVTAQVFRMGYYAALVPNTALAKEAFQPFWTRGVVYLVDFVAPYWLVVPLIPVLVMTARLMLSGVPARVRVVSAAVAIGGVLDAIYVVRLGGDFMHGRMLLPAVFALTLPAMLWPAGMRRGTSALANAAVRSTLILLACWAAVCFTSLRVPYAGEQDASGIADEVNFYRGRARHPNPVAPEDFERWGAYQTGQQLRQLAASGERWLVFDHERWPLRSGVPAVIVTDGVMIGLAGFVAGPAVHMADPFGLADPIGSRVRMVNRFRPGHEKDRPRAWLVARYLDPEALPAVRVRYPAAPAALAALGCGDLAALVEAITQPLTLRRFLGNILEAPRLTRLRFAAEPERASAQVCASS